MSSTEIYAILKNGDVVLYSEVENSRSCSLDIYKILADKYHIKNNKNVCNWFKKVRGYFYQVVYEDPEEIILGTTLNNAIVMSHEEHNKDFSELIYAMRYFSKKHNHTNLSEQLKVIEIMAKDPDVIGVAWNQTSLSDCLWNDDENGYGYNIFKQNKHWDVLEKLDYPYVYYCEQCGDLLDCDCRECHNCNPETICGTCGGCHIDGWEYNACWSMENDPDYDPFDI